MNRYGKRCVLYPRVSTEMQVDGYSLEGQKNMLTRFADREEMIVVDTYEDAGKSGKSIEGRPAFQKMLRDIEDGLDIDYILVYKLSRFGRNAADILNSLELVQSYGVNLICIEEGIDSSQTSGKLLISVLSAVAEIERENIIEQTMNGRREKARQGGWNGGFAPYGYTLEDNKLMIEETEAVAIRKIFELYTSSEIGLGGIANQLNLQGIRKIPRQNGTLEDWTGHFIKLILDNPVYCGKIAYGRRTKEKVKGTKNDYQMKRNDDYILTEGQHKGIVSEEVWEKAHAKRLRTGVKQPSKIGRDRVHLLSGLLKCPVCGSPMYTNKHAWTNKDGTYKEIYYYVCSRNRMVRGKHCEYKAMLKKTDIEPMVIEAIREIVRNEEYAQAIKKRIGVQIDTKAVDKELEGYQAKLKEVDLNKTRLEREIDSLPADAKYRERKLHDMTLRLDSLYDVIVELEEKIEDARLRRDAIKQQAITLENIYKIMVNFDCVYNIINDEEKRNVVTALIKEIEIYRNDESEYPLKRIGLNFPVFKDGGEVTELLWDKGNTVEAVKFPEFQAVLYNYDNFVAGEPFRLYPAEAAGDDERCIYRGWMLQPEAYARLFEALKERKLTLINTPAEYENCHEFPLAYPAIADYTPGIRVYPEGVAIDWREVKHAFPRFMMKDYVKSVKGTDFPACFDSSYDDRQLDEYARRFQAMRGDLYVRGIVLKEYVELKRRDSITNEYRAFYLNGELLTLSPNSNQKEGWPVVPIELVNTIPVLDSHFYTVDFAELENGSWTVIETGDGQVSGLSPNQYVFKFYDEIRWRLCGNE